MSRSRRPLLAALAVATALGAASCGVDAGDEGASALITGGRGSSGTGAAPAAGSFEGTGGAVSLSKA
ncbi:MAG TPA: hypothetical protein VHK88_05855, partial [Aquihabitans sp.]|nr:hypothetical protein [Aquihabitans sp.]